MRSHAPRWRAATGDVARRRDGDIAPTATGPHGNGTRTVRTATGREGAGDQAANRGGEPPRAMRRGGASREARRPSIAPYRNGTAWQWDARGAHSNGARGGERGKGARGVRAARGTVRGAHEEGDGEGTGGAVFKGRGFC